MIEDKWDEIHKKNTKKEHFLRKTWFDAWSHFIDEDNNWQGKIDYQYICGDGDEAVIIPYAFQKIGPFRFASLAGGFFPHRGFIHANVSNILIEKTVKYISEINNIYGFRMGPVIENDIFIVALRKCFLQKKWKVISNDIGQDYGMKLPENEEDYFSIITKSKKKKIEYRKRSMEREGSLKVNHYNNITPKQWQQVFKELVVIESNSWIAKSGESRFVGDANQYYWNYLVKDEWYSKAINIWIMYFKDKPVCFSVSIDSEDTRYVVASSYDAEVKKYGVGNTVNLELVLNAIRKKMLYLNDGMGDSGYKQGWGAGQIEQLVDLVAFPPTIKGRIAYYLALLKSRIRR